MRYLVKFRYYPGDPLQEIKDDDLQGIAERWGLGIRLEKIAGESEENEKTLDKDLGEISQTVITVEGDQESAFRGGLKEIIAIYRAPRTVYALWDSNAAGMGIAREIIEEMDGWW